jgi:hypothetical protein
MKKLTLLVLLLCVPAVCQSVAEAARAAKEKKQSAKKVITDEDMPSTSSSGTASNVDGSDSDAGWDADLERMRRAYKQVCSVSAPRTKMSAEQKKFLEDESQPMKARMEIESKEIDKLKQSLEQLKRDEATEVAAAGSDAATISGIHKRYAEQTKPIQARAAVSMRRVMQVLKESFGALGECLESASK